MLEAPRMAVIKRGTCAAGRTGVKVKQVESGFCRVLFSPG